MDDKIQMKSLLKSEKPAENPKMYKLSVKDHASRLKKFSDTVTVKFDKSHSDK